MGERAVASEPAGERDIAEMRALLRAALEAGAAGFTTGRTDIHRSVADYIAGMTDRYALREHERLTGRKLLATP